MSELTIKQFEFAIDLGRLLGYAAQACLDYKPGDALITVGDVFEDQQSIPSSHWIHMPGSLHSLRLAVDLNLIVDGELVTKEHGIWDKLGIFWKGVRIGNAWGGDFSSADYGHFSREHGGKK